MTLVSDLPGSARRHFIGIDNVAPAAPPPRCWAASVKSGKRSALIAGSLGLRDHRERYEGFIAVVAGANSPVSRWSARSKASTTTR